MKELDLTINNLSGTIPPSTYNISSLVSLALASSNLWGEIPRDIGIRLPNLLLFNFCINKFTSKISWSLHNLTNMKVICMADNLLEGTIPPGLGNLSFLEMYNIGFTRIVSDGSLSFITSLKNSTRLSFLAIDGNYFKGVIPESIGNLSNRRPSQRNFKITQSRENWMLYHLTPFLITTRIERVPNSYIHTHGMHSFYQFKKKKSNRYIWKILLLQHH